MVGGQRGSLAWTWLSGLKLIWLYIWSEHRTNSKVITGNGIDMSVCVFDSLDLLFYWIIGRRRGPSLNICYNEVCQGILETYVQLEGLIVKTWLLNQRRGAVALSAGRFLQSSRIWKMKCFDFLRNVCFPVVPLLTLLALCVPTRYDNTRRRHRGRSDWKILPCGHRKTAGVFRCTVNWTFFPWIKAKNIISVCFDVFYPGISMASTVKNCDF